ncbi:hypothetical protein GcM3_015042 [Golovinomyces cichoracearum]|uniref:Uncharacterized protein n=1 Tax=Golovinomyces cichoracearum TaxID=62708 RepID=A0A420J8Z3_9PEZI|nr:hypothetical protein GcM3_015042 [Golovinomyces cichoracearum]
MIFFKTESVTLSAFFIILAVMLYTFMITPFTTNNPRIKYHYDTEFKTHQYYTDQKSVTFTNCCNKLPDKNLQGVLDEFLR